MKIITILLSLTASLVSATTLTLNRSSDWKPLPEAQQQAVRAAYGKYLQDFSSSDKFPGVTVVLLDQPNNAPPTNLRAAKEQLYLGCKDSAGRAGQTIGPMNDVSFGVLPGILFISQLKIGDAVLNSMTTVGFSKDHIYTILLYAPETFGILSPESTVYKRYFSQLAIDDVSPMVETSDAYLMGRRIGALTMFSMVAVLIVAAIRRLIKGPKPLVR